MIGVKTRTALFFIVVLGIAVLCGLAVFHKPTDERVKHRKSFGRTVSEGMRLWNPKAGADSDRFDSCRSWRATVVISSRIGQKGQT